MAPWTDRFDEQDVFMGHERGKSNDIHVTRNSWDGVWNLVGCRAVLALTHFHETYYLHSQLMLHVSQGH